MRRGLSSPDGPHQLLEGLIHIEAQFGGSFEVGHVVGGTEGGGFRSGDLGGGRVGYGGVRCLLSRLVPSGIGGRQKDTPCALTGVT